MIIHPDSIKRRIAVLEARPVKSKRCRDSIRYYRNLLRATPAWLTAEDFKAMKHIYQEAHKQGLVIDHIVPLRGTLVSGLHVPWNLQAMDWRENSKKGNLWWPDSPFEQGKLSLHPPL